MNAVRVEPEPLVLTAGQAAKLLGLHRETVYRYTKSGLLPSIRIGGCVRIPLDGLKRWLAAQEQAR